MILDKGICSIFRRNDRAFTLVCKSWYGQLSFATQAADENKAVGAQISARLRILQDSSIAKDDVAVLGDTDTLLSTEGCYEVTRAYHGADDDNGQPITDLTLAESLMVEQIYLIAGEPSTDNMGNQTIIPSNTDRREIAAEVQAVSMQERYKAMAYDEQPEIRLLIYADEYEEQPFVSVASVTYQIQHKAHLGKKLELICGEGI